MTGAFNGPASTERIAESLRKASDVFVLDYVFLIFHPFEALFTLYRALVEKDDAKSKDDEDDAYEVVALVGGSLGGLLSLLFIAYDRRRGGRFRSSLCVMGMDSPLRAEHLLVPGTNKPAPAGFARWLTGLRPGPVWNWLTSFVMRLVFAELPLDQHSADIGQWNRHTKFLKGTKLSLFLSQTAAIASQPPLDPADFAGIPGGYLKCAKDEVIVADAALAEWKRLFPDLLVEDVPNSGHLQWVEHDIEWQEAIVSMLYDLIARVIRSKREALNG